MRSQKPNKHANSEPFIRRHVLSDGFSNNYHARVDAHVPDSTRPFALLLQCIYYLGQCKRPSFQRMPAKSQQLPPTHTCGLPRIQ
ncbi:hypothetical protein Hanom_Chr17g01583051 [Helianthus anomalus]